MWPVTTAPHSTNVNDQWDNTADEIPPALYSGANDHPKRERDDLQILTRYKKHQSSSGDGGFSLILLASLGTFISKSQPGK